MTRDYYGSINLETLIHVKKTITDKDGNEVKVLIIPIEENGLIQGEKSINANIRVRTIDEVDKYGNNGFISKQVPIKKIFGGDITYADLSQEDKDKMNKLSPILGNIRLYERQAANNEIAHLDFEPLKIQLYIVFICWVIILFAVAIDFHFGVKKSQKNGQPYIHSYGIRKSGQKLAQYFTVMIFMFFLDVINPFWVYSDLESLPLCSIIGCAVWVWTERKSVMEKFDDKIRSDFSDNSKDLLHTLDDIRAEMKNVTSDLADIRENSQRMKKTEDESH